MKRLERVYEGPDVLGQLLADSGCELTVDEVTEEFVCAAEEGTPGSEIVPLLWELEPRFPNAETARRTFSNLFGLWDAVAAEMAGDLVALPVVDPDAPLTPEFVDRAWQKLDATPEREQRATRDRFDNVQGDVTTWLFEELQGYGDEVAEAALELAFELWWLQVEARGAAPRGTRAALVAARDPEGLHPEPEPALASLVTTTLFELAADEERPLPESAIPAVEAALRAVRRVLSQR